MLSCEVKINGVLIDYIYAHNAEMVTDDLARYDYEVYMCRKGIRRGRVEHHRQEGGLRLISIIIEDVLKKKRRDKKDAQT